MRAIVVDRQIGFYLRKEGQVVKHLWCVAATAGALMCVSCGKSNGLYPVTGKVLVKGGPAVGASVTFVRKGGVEAFSDKLPQGIVNEDGTFDLFGPSGKGALPGEYVVLVEWKEGAGKVAGRSPALIAPDQLQKKYLDPEHPLLAATMPRL